MRNMVRDPPYPKAENYGVGDTIPKEQEIW